MVKQSFIFWMNQDDQPSSVIAMKLGNAQNFLIRLTGGCGFMDRQSGQQGVSLLTKALSGFGGILLYGGTRVYEPNQAARSGYRIFPTILEVPPRLRKLNPNMMSFGIIPKMTHVEYSKIGLIIGKEKSNGFLTVIHQNQDICLVLQKNVDQISFWDAEWMECLSITKEFLEHRHSFQAILISYNGGTVTSHEIEAWANAGLPVLLVAGSGRVTSEYCQNQDWLDKHPSVIVCHTHQDIRRQLIGLGGICE